tara:strand:+ start:3136 stop:3903 length:768 start_codon:yes stop_codon:yes gene_type:complete
MMGNLACVHASRRNLVGLITLLFSIASLNAQSTANAEETPLRVNFSVFSLKHLSDIHYLLGDRTVGAPLTFYSSDRSSVYTYEGLNPIVFYRETPAPTELDPDAVKRKKIGEISLTPPGGDYLFIFFPNPNTEDENYRIYPLDDSTKALPYGSVRFFNATSLQLIGKLDKITISTGPGPSKAFPLTGSSHSLAFGFEHGGKYHVSFRSPFELNQDSRGIFVVSPPYIKGSALLQTRLLRDTRLAEDNNQNVKQSD